MFSRILLKDNNEGKINKCIIFSFLTQLVFEFSDNKNIPTQYYTLSQSLE